MIQLLETDTFVAQCGPRELANMIHASAYLRWLPAMHLLLPAFVAKRAEANPQDVSNTVWAVATMEQQIPQQHLEQLLAALARKVDEAEPQHVANTVWACAKLKYTHVDLLTALDSKHHVLQKLLAAVIPQDLANTALACAHLGYSSTSLPAVLLQRAVKLLQCPGKQHNFETQHLCNLAWSAALLDLQQLSPTVLQLVKACSGQWGEMATEALQQLYQIHLWLLDCQLSAAGPKGLSGCLTEQQLQDCRHCWEQQLQQEASAETASPLQRKVFKAICQLLPDSTWQQQPELEQRTADGAFSTDIAAVTSTGVQLAIKVDGPSHFLLQPVRAIDGPTAFRNRALEARGYRVVSIPFFEWDELQTDEQQLKYLASKLGVAAAAG